MSKNCIAPRSLTLALAALLAATAPLRSLDVSHFLSPESAADLPSGSPASIAYDGTNFLIAARSTNGGIMAFRLATNAMMQGTRLDLCRTGGPPRVAFDGRNYLVTWPDFADPPSDIYGQFIRPDGTMAGAPFLIEADADAQEMGGLDFDGTNYLAVWESGVGNGNAISSVKGRFITPAGDFFGPRLEISAGTTPQKFPDVAWNGESHLVIWTGQGDGTNSWDIRGFRLNRQGARTGSMTISENPAQQPWPPTVASDGTNWLVAWTRESGPYPVLASNVWLPMLYGRIVARDGAVSANEVQIRWGGLGQFKPKATFNGQSYLVGWMERVRWDQTGPPPYLGWFWKPAVRQLDSAGQPLMTEFRIVMLINLFVIDPPAMAICQGAGRFLVAFDAWGQSIWATTLVNVNRSFALHNLTRAPNGDAQFDLVAPGNRLDFNAIELTSYGVELTTNLVDWRPVLNTQDGLNLYIYSPGRITVSAALVRSADRCLFRAFDGQTLCRENLRLMVQALDHWALENNKTQSDSPLDSDLFGPGRYLPSKPVCPNGGHYESGYLIGWCTLVYAAGHWEPVLPSW